MTPQDPAVQSIQIATTLIFHVQQLMRQPAFSPDQLELKLGEAQQVTPEIWRHLDTARDVMAKRGLDVHAYNEMRAGRDPALLATKNIEVSEKLDWVGLAQGQLRIEKTKTVTWDGKSLLAAMAAMLSLRAQLPDVDWEALDRADREQIESVGSLHAAPWKSAKRWMLGALVLAALLGGVFLVVQLTKEGPRSTEQGPTPVSTENRVKHAAKIAELQQKYAANPCDETTMRALTAYMFADGQEAAVREIEEKFAADCPKPGVAKN